MSLEWLTDAKIEELQALRKVVRNPKARMRAGRSSDEFNYQVESLDGNWEFKLYVRQSRRDPEDFSCGLSVHPMGDDAVTLARYNGPSHEHTNQIERDVISFKCHIHRATERYVMAGHRQSSFAVETDRYASVRGALECLVDDWNISGLDLPDSMDLFN